MSSTLYTEFPKAELHVHLEGTLEPSLLLALAARNNVPVSWSSVEEVQRAYNFENLEHFLRLLFRGAAVLRQRRDFYELTYAYLRRARHDGVIRAEAFFGAQTFLDAGVPLAVQLDGIFQAIEHARDELDIDGAVILTAQRHRT
jgi:adenosine deaminase